MNDSLYGRTGSFELQLALYVKLARSRLTPLMNEIPRDNDPSPEVMSKAAPVVALLSREKDLFTPDHFPFSEDPKSPKLYLLSEELDHSLALCVSSNAQNARLPLHYHETTMIAAGAFGASKVDRYQPIGSTEPERTKVVFEKTLEHKRGITTQVNFGQPHNLYDVSQTVYIGVHLYGRNLQIAKKWLINESGYRAPHPLPWTDLDLRYNRLDEERVVDLTCLLNKDYPTTLLAGKDNGVQARTILELDKRDEESDPKLVYVPEEIVSIVPSFFEGLFASSLSKLKTRENFQAHYRFVTNHLMTKQINGAIEDLVWQQATRII